MSGPSSDGRVPVWRACLLLAAAAILVAATPPLSASVPAVARADMMAVAKEMADHRWVCAAANLLAPCVKNYRSAWHVNQRVTGVAYDWGGMDTVAAFDGKLAAGQGAGSHADQGVSTCTTGADCSGFVSICWKQTQKFGTATMSQIATVLTVNIFRELKPGDALNKPGSHIVLFVSYNPDGTINVYEASGQRSRVVLSRGVPWSRFRSYAPIRYNGAVD